MSSVTTNAWLQWTHFFWEKDYFDINVKEVQMSSIYCSCFLQVYSVSVLSTGVLRETLGVGYQCSITAVYMVPVFSTGTLREMLGVGYQCSIEQYILFLFSLQVHRERRQAWVTSAVSEQYILFLFSTGTQRETLDAGYRCSIRAVWTRRRRCRQQAARTLRARSTRRTCARTTTLSNRTSPTTNRYVLSDGSYSCYRQHTMVLGKVMF